jgi:hypothetical protein
MKTAMQELIEFIDDKFIVSNSPQISSIYYKSQELLEKEKEQIMNAVSYGCSDWGSSKDEEKYYNQTYNKK